MIKRVIGVVCLLGAILPANAQSSIPGRFVTLPPPTPPLRTIFTPTVNGTDEYLKWLDARATKSVKVIIYTFTDQRIADEYVKLLKKGIKVDLIMDLSESKAVKKEQAIVKQLIAAGANITIRSSPVRHAIVHCKYTIVDDQYVEDGSFNYTAVANDQVNDLNFTDEPNADRTALFLEDWQSLTGVAK